MRQNEVAVFKSGKMLRLEKMREENTKDFGIIIFLSGGASKAFLLFGKKVKY